MTTGATTAPGRATVLGPAKVVFTDRGDGDMGHGGDYVFEVSPAVDARRRAVIDRPWVWLRQVHGSEVLLAGPGPRGAGRRADAAVTTHDDCAIAVLVADCAPVALSSDEGVIGVAHAGWAGLVAGVLERTVEQMRAIGATAVRAVLGPCIHPGCYRFGAGDLDTVAARLGDGVRSTAADGAPALDLPAGVRLALSGVGVDDVSSVEVCTACSAQHFSWRARQERQRQAVVVWL